jgi:ribosome assembly protein YihI (activator of Der GTPase)
MAFVQKAVARLDEKEKLDKLLEELGKNHFYYGAPKKYIDVCLDCFKFYIYIL